MEVALTGYEIQTIRNALGMLKSNAVTAKGIIDKLPETFENAHQVFYVLTTREEYEGRGGTIPETVQCYCGERVIVRNGKATCQQCGGRHEVLPGRKGKI